MHELAVAVSLAETLIKYMEEHHLEISAAHLRVGRFSGIDPEALKFAWEPAAASFPGYGLENCALKITVPLIKHLCRACGGTFEAENWQLKCPACGEEALRRENGNEFILESAEVKDV